MTGRKLSKLTAVLSISLLSAACAGDPEREPGAQAVADVVNTVFHHAKWRQVPATPENQAEGILFQQSVFFGDGSAAVDRQGQQAIDALLNEADPDPGTTLSLSAGDRAVAGYDRLTLQRLEAVRLALADRGYDAVLDPALRVPAAGTQGNEIRLNLIKYMAILPNCEQLQPLEPDTPAFESALGCATASNLGAMVVNPADLEQGRPLEPADGEALSRSVMRYRVGDIEPLVEEDTKSQ
ncbi:hypothetical protein HBA54_01230 [Pelagibius litoralis]|uniref:Pilus assembly protein CpaD n=1 Tax=Pelagibius litoralis TaxID=374515 RepID=A0A967C2M8_9PROT|nr:CpaD family pilus assembly lipoprotein [Pelagibius litoralis]NIA67209.1 hypothetical protein [Pelagibius litoralis]